MSLKRTVRAGILLYALLMSAIMALLLQFYHYRVQTAYQLRQQEQQMSQAYLLAELAKPLATKESGEVIFDKGVVTYIHKDGKLYLTVKSRDKSYRYIYLKEWRKPEKEFSKTPHKEETIVEKVGEPDTN